MSAFDLLPDNSARVAVAFAAGESRDLTCELAGRGFLRTQVLNFQVSPSGPAESPIAKSPSRYEKCLSGGMAKCSDSDAVLPSAVARWLVALEHHGLVLRQGDERDTDGAFVVLAPESSNALRRYFAEVVGSTSCVIDDQAAPQSR